MTQADADLEQTIADVERHRRDLERITRQVAELLQAANAGRANLARCQNVLTPAVCMKSRRSVTPRMSHAGLETLAVRR